MMRQWVLFAWLWVLIALWWLRRMTLALGLGIGLILNIYLVLYLSCTDCLPTLAILNHVTHWLLLGGIFTTLLVMLLGAPTAWRRGISLWLSPSLIAFGVWYGPLFLPRPTPSAHGIVIDVATYNILGAYADWNATYQVIANNPVDILVLQEMRGVNDHLIRTQLAERYPYRVADRDRGFNGNGIAIYSRYPILEAETHVFAEPRTILKIRPDYIRAVIDVGQPIVVYGFHAAVPTIRAWYEYDEWGTRYQTALMIARVQQETLPTLVLCDCNTTPRTRLYDQWDTILDDAFQAVGHGFGNTFMVDIPRLGQMGIVRIDYVWHSPHFRPLAAQLDTTPNASDHALLHIQLDLNP